jgi:Flp pilus assembly protein TadD
VSAAAPSARSAAASKAAPGGTAAAGAAGTAALTSAERDEMARSAHMLTASSTRDLKEALRMARELADAHPAAQEVQYLAAEACYRNSRWGDAVVYFRRGGTPDDDRPELLFYMAVSLYEMGDQPAAATALRRSLPNLQKTPYVESYAKRILGQ